MMSGRIVIGSKVGGMAEISGGSKGVLLVEPGNVRELAGTIDYVGGMDREKISDLATQNVDSINRLLSEEESVKRFFRVCEKTLVA